MPTRRHALALLAAAPFAGCAPSADPAAAWRTADAAQTDPRRFALAHAILAPNPHNTQPWQIEFDAADGMTLYCDLQRRLPVTDPLDRQITLGCGAFLELYRIAAAHLGYAASVEPFPDGAPTPRLDQRPLARVKLGPQSPGAAGDPMFAHIAARRTNRNAYDISRVPAQSDLQKLTDAAAERGAEAEFTVDPQRVAKLRDLVWRGWAREESTRGALEETFGWLRFGRAQIAAHKDGLAVDGAVIGPMRMLGLFSHDQMVDPNSFANKQAAQEWKHKADTAPAFAWLSMPQNDDTPAGRLTAGMAYARMNLAATAAGLSIHPWSQVLEEYAEMADLRRETRALLQDDENFLHMLVRVGYAAPVEPAARRDVAAFIRT